jgi:hypothetical protein
MERGWYCPEFGLRRETGVLTWRATCELPAATGWCLTWNGTQNLASLKLDRDHAWQVTWDGQLVCNLEKVIL